MFYNKATLWYSLFTPSSAISYVTGGSVLVTQAATATVSLSGTQAGDTVFLIAHAARTSGTPITCTVSGYTLKTQTTYLSNYSGLFWKRLTAAETSVSVTSDTLNTQTSVSVIVLRGCNTSPFPDNPTFITGGFPSSQIDPPVVTPSVTGSVVLALGSIAVDNIIVNITALSSGFNNPQFTTGSGSTTPGARCGICWKEWTSGSLDPGAFSLNYTNNALGVLSLSAIILPA